MAKLQRRIRPTMRAFRDLYGLTQRQAAAVLGLRSTLHVSHVEIGNRQMSEPVQLLIRVFYTYPDVFRDRAAELGMELRPPDEPTSTRRRRRPRDTGGTGQ